MGRRRELTGLRTLITGASQGIGRGLALAAARKGMRVLATARSQELLDELAAESKAAGHSLEVLRADVTSPDDRRAMLAAMLDRFGGIDVLVNNAGIGATGHLVDSDPQTLRQIMEVNFFGAAELIRVCLPELKRGTTPAILNISSVLARRAMAARGLYSASKFALQAFGEALRAEIDKDGVDVVVVNPGLTQTNFSQNMLERKGKAQLDHLRGMTPDQVAEAALKALARGKHEITLTRNGRLLLLVNRIAPKVIDLITRKRIARMWAEDIAARGAGRAGG